MLKLGDKCSRGGYLRKRHGKGNCDVEAARIVKDEDKEEERTVPEHGNARHDVGHQHAGQDEVGLGPESGRQPDSDQRKAVTAQVEYGHSEENGRPHNCGICW